MNVELFMYFKQYLLVMFKMSHLDEEATRYEKVDPLSRPFFFLSFAAPRFFGLF